MAKIKLSYVYQVRIHRPDKDTFYLYATGLKAAKALALEFHQDISHFNDHPMVTYGEDADGTLRASIFKIPMSSQRRNKHGMSLLRNLSKAA